MVTNSSCNILQLFEHGVLLHLRLPLVSVSRTKWIDKCSLFPHPSRANEMKERFRHEKTALQQLDETFPELGIYHQGHPSLVE